VRFPVTRFAVRFPGDYQTVPVNTELGCADFALSCAGLFFSFVVRFIAPRYPRLRPNPRIPDQSRSICPTPYIPPRLSDAVAKDCPHDIGLQYLRLLSTFFPAA
jgi:hypothetical protein